MFRPLSMLGSAALGAVTMYFFDPDRGKRRRALCRDQFASAYCRSKKAADVVYRDTANRLTGAAAELRASLRHQQPPDDVLAQRVRSKLGRVVSHPRAIEANVSEGRVVLSGPILADEVEPLLACVEGVRGVASVQADLDVHETPGNCSALQGEGRQPRGPLEQNWSPAFQAAMGAAAIGVTALCVGRRA